MSICPVCLYSLFSGLLKLYVPRLCGGGLFLESLQEAWFIYVIMIQYFVFFISWTVSKGRQELLLILNFILSLAVATALYFTNVNARWYNGLLLFPIGMTVACYEKKLLASFQKNWLLHLGLHLIIFILAGGAFTYVKGSSAAADLLKMLAGASMGLLVCIIYMRVRSVSGIMRYIGRRSLFFYLVHLELRSAITKIENMDSVTAFYLILPLTFILSEIFYALCQRATEKIWKRRNTEAMGKISKETSGLIRAVAMLMVVTAHFSQWYTKAADAGVVVGLLTKLGRYGVAMFFAISGYGLVSSALNGLDRSYFKKRLANVYLPYLVLSFLIRLFTADKWSFRELCLWLGGCDAWFVSVILVFYIIFYFCWKYCRHKIGAVALGVAAVSLLLAVTVGDEVWYSSNFSFVVGICVKVYEDEIVSFLTKCKAICLIALGGGFLGSAAVYMVMADRNFWLFIICKILASVLWASLCMSIFLVYDPRWAVRLHIDALGKVSLECYLLHRFILHLMEGLIENPAVVLAAAFVLTMLCSFATNRLFAKAGKMMLRS